MSEISFTVYLPKFIITSHRAPENRAHINPNLSRKLGLSSQDVGSINTVVVGATVDVGTSLRATDGKNDGLLLGVTDGKNVGLLLGVSVGKNVGLLLGVSVGNAVGLSLVLSIGRSKGFLESVVDGV